MEGGLLALNLEAVRPNWKLVLQTVYGDVLD